MIKRLVKKERKFTAYEVIRGVAYASNKNIKPSPEQIVDKINELVEMVNGLVQRQQEHKWATPKKSSKGGK